MRAPNTESTPCFQWQEQIKYFAKKYLPADIRHMRFYADGPSIPSELLEARDKGEVVFLVGAGASMPAGFPSFWKLTAGLIASGPYGFGVPQTSDSRKLYERACKETDAIQPAPLDRIIGLLQNEYGVQQVEERVIRRLKTPRNANVSHHQAILKLSSDVDGRCRLVTTNFDLLFEVASAQRLKWHAGPSLPDLVHGPPLEGIVYLHGRLTTRRRNASWHQALILSQADFGRAYLYMGWATRFLRALFDRYTVVLLGYSAEDPPIRYLFEGLHSMPSPRTQRIYTFAEGSQSEVDAKWASRGVKALAYPASPDYSNLWETIHAWAERASDTGRWKNNVIDMARSAPGDLTPHERGQVVELVSAVGGAKEFADANPPRSSDWLQVFDSRLRLADVGPWRRDDPDAVLDPRSLFGLDDDPSSSSLKDTSSAAQGIDVLGPLTAQERIGSTSSLAGQAVAYTGNLPTRLHHLARWISRIADQPKTVWWAVGRATLHPTLRDMIEWRVSDGAFSAPSAVQLAWRLLFEAQRQSWTLRHDAFTFARRAKGQAWSKSDIREYSRLMKPFIKLKQASVPPQVIDGEELSLKSIFTGDLEFAVNLVDEIEIQDQSISAVVAAVQTALEEAISLFADLQKYVWSSASLHPSDDPGTHHYRNEEKVVAAFAKLFKRLVELDPELARAQFGTWPKRDDYFFDKLRVWALMMPALASPSGVAKYMLAAPQEVFWRSAQQRELLWTLKERWSDLSSDERQAIESRMLNGPDRWEDEDESKYELRRTSMAVDRLIWLQTQGCALATSTVDAVGLLRSAVPAPDNLGKQADRSLESRAGWVATIKDPNVLAHVPISEIIRVAERQGGRKSQHFEEHDPFWALVESKPTLALAALSHESRASRYPAKFWRSILSHWPENASARAANVLAGRLAALPAKCILELRYYAPNWMHTRWVKQVDPSPQHWTKIWDAVFSALQSDPSIGTQSALMGQSIAGKEVPTNRMTFDHAINSPVGHLAEFLIEVLSRRGYAENSLIPPEIRLRMEQCLNASGEGAANATSILGHQLVWLHWMDPNWVEASLLPKFTKAAQVSEAAWSGFLYSNQAIHPSFFRKMKPMFLDALEQSVNWDADAQEQLGQRLGALAVSDMLTSFMTVEEMRNAFQAANETVRGSAIHQIQFMTTSEIWDKGVKQFIDNIWPKELRVQTAESASAFADIAVKSGPHFPEAVATVLPLLRPVEHPDVFVFHINDEQMSDEVLSKRFPSETIELLGKLIAENAPYAPYGLGSVLEISATAKPTLRQDLTWRRLNDLVTRS